MKNKKLDKLTEIKDLRSVFQNEASGFTPWLAGEDGIELLSDAIGLEIVVEETESSVGSFRTDILAYEKNSEKKVIIENQLEDTNHDHLGKLITYASGKDAQIIIWIVRHARDEHRSAIEWLNNNTNESIAFFLCEIKLFQIGDSNIAPKFEVIESPNEWSKKEKEIYDSINSSSSQFRYHYWEEFQKSAFNNPEFAKCFSRRKPSTHSWLSFSIGSSECRLNSLMFIRKKKIAVELYISDNKELFSALNEAKHQIESETGLSFTWMELPERKASRIVIENDASLNDESKWLEQFKWLADVMIKMSHSFKKYL